MKSIRSRISVVFISGLEEDPESADAFLGDDFDARVLLIILFYSFDIGTRAGVDFDFFAGVDKQRYANFNAILHCRRLQRARGGIALNAGLGILNFQYNV